MKKLNTYIYEAWSGVKQQSNIGNKEAWCEEMGIENYTINSKGEIDVDGNVDLSEIEFEKLPYKFGIVTGYFDVGYNKKLTSLENCPDKVGTWFGCSHNPKIDSLEGCPKEVGKNFYCGKCKRRFTSYEVKELCKYKGAVFV